MTRPVLHHVVRGEGRDVILIHGVGANLQSWDETIAAYGPGARFIAMDLRGHGKSSPIREEYSIEKFAEDIIGVMDHLGVARADVAGFSLGGLIAQAMAVHYPERIDRLALLSAVAGRTEEERSKVVGRLDMIRQGGIVAVTGAAKDRWFTDEFVKNHPERIEARIKELIANDVESYMEAYRVFGLSELGPRLHEIPHRTLVLTGEHDVGSNTRMARFMHEQIKDSELVILPGLRHSILVEVPGLVASHLKRFLEEDRAMTDRSRFEKGLAKRRATLGADYVDKALNAATPFSKEFQELVTEYCWGVGWGDETLDARTRSIMNLTMIAALNRMHEWELHFRGAMRNGVTEAELKAIIVHIMIYCGVPTGVECNRIANKVLAEKDKA
jgi:pimeloyl-ACP methyl ester carboxylesterase/alkylhydroperoxidase/carboxymuconolactone decarboxylase family protein YurZ